MSSMEIGPISRGSSSGCSNPQRNNWPRRLVRESGNPQIVRPFVVLTTTCVVSSMPRFSWTSSGNRDQAHSHNVLSGLTLPAISIQSGSAFNRSARRAFLHQGLRTSLIQVLREATSSSNEFIVFTKKTNDDNRESAETRRPLDCDEKWSLKRTFDWYRPQIAGLLGFLRYPAISPPCHSRLISNLHILKIPVGQAIPCLTSSEVRVDPRPLCGCARSVAHSTQWAAHPGWARNQFSRIILSRITTGLRPTCPRWIPPYDRQYLHRRWVSVENWWPPKRKTNGH